MLSIPRKHERTHPRAEWITYFPIDDRSVQSVGTDCRCSLHLGEIWVRSAGYLNPRPDTVFRHLRSDKVGAIPLDVSKGSVVELSGKDQQIALAEHSRLVVLFLVLRQYLTQLWQVKGQIFGNSMMFQLYESISVTLSIVAAWDLHQHVLRSILHNEVF